MYGSVPPDAVTASCVVLPTVKEEGVAVNADTTGPTGGFTVSVVDPMAVAPLLSVTVSPIPKVPFFVGMHLREDEFELEHPGGRPP